MSVGLSMYLLIRDTENIKSGLVAVKYIRVPINYLKLVMSTSSPLPSLDNFEPGVIGLCTGLLVCIPNLSRISVAYLP